MCNLFVVVEPQSESEVVAGAKAVAQYHLNLKTLELLDNSSIDFDQHRIGIVALKVPFEEKKIRL